MSRPLVATLRTIFSGRMLVCLTTGFSSGLPLYVLIQLLPAWLRESEVDLAMIGVTSLIGFPYTWKFLWAPLIDRSLPIHPHRRRGWAFVAQLVLLVSLASLSGLDPRSQLTTIWAVGTVIAFASATQDVALDAYRREILADEELGFGNSVFVNAYRLASLVPGSLALILADHVPWSQVHLTVAGFMGVGLLTTAWMPEPTPNGSPPRDLRSAVVEPFRAFFHNRGFKNAIGILAFMLLYKLGDSMAVALLTPFYLDIGFSMTEIGTVAKAASLWSAIAGGFGGGLIMLRIGIHRALWLFGAVQMLSIFGFAWLAYQGPDPTALFLVVSFEYLGVGLGTAAFVSFIASVTDRRYTATQFALLTSLTSVPRTFANAVTGYMVEAMGYPTFFVMCGIIALPGLLMLPWVAPWTTRDAATEPKAQTPAD